MISTFAQKYSKSNNDTLNYPLAAAAELRLISNIQKGLDKRWQKLLVEFRLLFNQGRLIFFDAWVNYCHFRIYNLYYNFA